MRTTKSVVDFIRSNGYVTPASLAVLLRLTAMGVMYHVKQGRWKATKIGGQYRLGYEEIYRILYEHKPRDYAMEEAMKACVAYEKESGELTTPEVRGRTYNI